MVGEDQLLEVAAQLGGLDAQHEADGVHQVGLARSIGPDHAGEVLEGPYHLRPAAVPVRSWPLEDHIIVTELITTIIFIIIVIIVPTIITCADSQRTSC